MANQVVKDIVIVGAGIAGLSVSLGLHRLGLSSLVLESSECLRTTGFALAVWRNAWKALDALGVADYLRRRSVAFQGIRFSSLDTGLSNAELTFEHNEHEENESRCIKRSELIDALAKELPHGTIRYSSKLVAIEESGQFKLVHLEDGCVIRTKVLIGCDGVNSVVRKWLGLPDPISVGRSAIRGLVEYPDAHNFTPKLYIHFGGGVRFGFAPCDHKSVYWFCTFTQSTSNWHEDMARNPATMKEFVLSKIGNVPEEVLDIVERSNLDSIYRADLRIRPPWDILFRDIAKGNTCVIGDALHPMTPDVGQGACSALEDGVILARCIGKSFKQISERKIREGKTDVDEEMTMLNKGVEKYEKYRKWRSFSLMAASRVVGLIQESDDKLMCLLREKLLSKFTLTTMWWMSDYDCGKLDEF